MAKTSGGILVKKQQEQQQVAKASPLQLMLGRAEIQAKFEKMLGDESAGFMSSILSVCNDSDLLRKADPRTILSAAATAASLKLPINKALGKAWIVPYNGQAAFQLGWKGAVELAMRSGKLKHIGAFPCCEGEITKWDKFTETIERGEKTSEKVVGYYAYFELLNGFTKATYWTTEDVKAHALKYSQQCKYAGKLVGVWKDNFDQMACKTVLMSIVKPYCPMSIVMQQAVIADGSVTAIKADGEVETIDFIDTETGEVVHETPATDQAQEPANPPADFDVPMEGE